MLTFSLRSRFILCPHHPWIVVHSSPILLTIMLTFSLRSHFILCPHHLSFVVHPSPILLTIMLTYFSLGSRPFCVHIIFLLLPIRRQFSLPLCSHIFPQEAVRFVTISLQPRPQPRPQDALHFALLFLPVRFHIRTILLLPVFTLFQLTVLHLCHLLCSHFYFNFDLCVYFIFNPKFFTNLHFFYFSFYFCFKLFLDLKENYFIQKRGNLSVTLESDSPF